MGIQDLMRILMGIIPTNPKNSSTKALMGSRPPPPRPRRSFRVLVPFPASLSPRIRSRPRPDGPGSSRRRGGAASSSPALSGATGGSRASHRRLSPVSSLDAEERLQADGIRDADIKRLGRIGEDVKQLTQRARDNSFKPQVVRAEKRMTPGSTDGQYEFGSYMSVTMML